MKPEDLLDAMAEMPEEWVEGVNQLRMKKRKPNWIPWVVSAACVAILALTGYTAFNHRVPSSVLPEKTDAQITEVDKVPESESQTKTALYWNGELESAVTENYESGNDGQKGQTQKSQNTAMDSDDTEIVPELSWNERTTPGKYNSFLLDGKQYFFVGDQAAPIRNRKVTLVKSQKFTARDWDENLYTAVGKIYSLEGFSDNLVLGVQFDDSQNIYPYQNQGYVPETLGKFLHDIDFKNTVTWSQVCYGSNGASATCTVDKEKMNAILWENSAVPNDRTRPTGNKVTLVLHCKELGAIDKALYIYENGYISTNLTGLYYAFPVGKETTNQIVQTVLNKSFSEMQPNTGKEINTAPMIIPE